MWDSCFSYIIPIPVYTLAPSVLQSCQYRPVEDSDENRATPGAAQSFHCWSEICSSVVPALNSKINYNRWVPGLVNIGGGRGLWTWPALGHCGPYGSCVQVHCHEAATPPWNVNPFVCHRCSGAIQPANRNSTRSWFRNCSLFQKFPLGRLPEPPESEHPHGPRALEPLPSVNIFIRFGEIQG